MPTLEEQVQKLTEKVRQHQGKIILCFREFNVPGRFIGGIRGNRVRK
jgi:hypothetical protein